ncbi:MAG TPA: hypothetical protein VK425_12790, partial [Acidimicrobiales bacterium]|nr:hypothetical protein [Acidimicrobiales bacterium]
MVDALLVALESERCAFVIDDAHHADSDAGALIAHLGTHLCGEQRLVVMARDIPVGAGALRRGEFVQLTAADLALNLDETMALCRSGFGLEVTALDAKALEAATGGWTAAAVLAVARAARTGQPVQAVAEGATGPGHPAGAVAALLEEALDGLGRDRSHALAQVARLPLLDDRLVGLATGDGALFEDALKCGIPFRPARGTWWDLPGPVRDRLANLWPVDIEPLRKAAQEYKWRGEIRAALELLLSSGDSAEAAALLASISPEQAEKLDALELLAVFDELPAEAVEAHPSALVLMARQLLATVQYERGYALVQRALAVAARVEDPVLERAARAELLYITATNLDHITLETEARRILSQSSPDERVTRGRAYTFLGVALCGRVDAAGRRDEGALREAEECFGRASDLFLSLGMRSGLAMIAPYWAIRIEFARGRAAAAMARIEDALASVANKPRQWGYLMIWRAWFAADLGQDELCRASAREVERIGEQLNSEVLLAQAHWKLAILASYNGDPELTLHHLRQVEVHKGSWWVPGSGDFLAEAADLLDRVGHVALAREYLQRVKEEPKDVAHLVALSEAIVEARHGDPVFAQELLLQLSAMPIDPREYWRITLFWALAAFRCGDATNAGAVATQAFEEAARLGQPMLPLIRERVVTEQLLGLAAATGQPAALAVRTSALP